MVQSPLPVPVQTPGSARVLIIDDHAILREGLASLIEVGGDFTVVGDAATLPDGVGLAETRNELVRFLPGVTVVAIARGATDCQDLTRACI